jgi:hypothetical protein
MERRDLIQLLATVPAFAQGQRYTPRFFTKDEFAKLATLTATLIPDEPGSPGAPSANAGYYIDTVLLYADAAQQDQWRKGLALIEPAQFPQLAAAELKPSNDAERFFGAFKRLTIEAFLQSEAANRFFSYQGGHSVPTFPGCPTK